MRKLSSVLCRTEDIRNVCFLAHVDHGKTTLSDSLISYAGIISDKLSGRLRYLDNRNDEQQRMITIKSSSISLLYSVTDHNVNFSNCSDDSNRQYLINLMDSPGHVDFSVEVSTVVRLCDGALLIIDVVEGICPQTKAVLRQAWNEGVKTALVLNKLDRLILDLHMTPREAYRRLRELVDQANALMYQFYVEEISKDEERLCSSVIEDKQFYFPSEGNVIFCSAIHRWCINLPEFSLQISQKLKTPKNKVDILQKALWGEFHFCGTTKSVKPSKGSEKPFFVQFVLEQVWKVYDSIMLGWNPEEISKCVRYCSAPLSSRQTVLLQDSPFPTLEEREELLKTIMSTWLPLSVGIFRVIVDCLPNPICAAKERLKRICPAVRYYHACDEVLSCKTTEPVVVHVAKFLGCNLKLLRLTGDVLQGKEQAGEFVAFARIFSGSLRVGDWLNICDSSMDNNFTEFKSPEEKKRIRVDRLMICMGTDLIDIDTAWPGNIVAISLHQDDCDHNYSHNMNELFSRRSDIHGYVKNVVAWILSLGSSHRRVLKDLDDHCNRSQIPDHGVFFNAERRVTLSSDANFPAFPPLFYELKNSILRVSVEPQNVKHMDELLIGLALLYIADPAVELDVSKTGEYVLVCRGEVHLERCLNDLSNIYAKIPINASKPRVSIREGIVNLPTSDLQCLPHYSANSKVNFPPWQNSSLPVEEVSLFDDSFVKKKSLVPIDGFYGVYMTVEAKKMGTEYVVTSGGEAAILVRAVQIPSEVLCYLDENSSEIRSIINRAEVSSHYNTNRGNHLTDSRLDQIENAIKKCWINESSQTRSESDRKNYIVDVGYLWGISAHKGSRCLLFYNDNNGLRVLDQNSPLNTLVHRGTSTQTPKQNLVKPPPLNWSLKHSYQHRQLDTTEDYRSISYIISGFEIACQSGPLAEEPLRGVAFIIEGFYTCGASAPRNTRQELIVSGSNYKPSENSSTPTQKCQTGNTGELSAPTLSDNFKLEGETLDLQTREYGRKPSIPGESEPSSDLELGIKNPEESEEIIKCSQDSNPCDKFSTKHSEAHSACFSRNFQNSGPSSGKIISAMRNVCRRAFMQRGRPRIFEMLLRLELQCGQSVLGRVYSVLQKRRTQILSENVKSGTSTFLVEALMPFSESFELARDLRSKTSGDIVFHFDFSHWEMITEDPFPEVSIKNKELEDDGFNMALMLQANVPRKIINYIRKMKGLPTEEKVVNYAEKQRTLSTK